MWDSGDDKDPIGQVLLDFTVVIDPERLSNSRLALLKQFAEPVSSHTKRSLFRLTAESIERGRACGVTSREIMFLLRHINGRDLPESVATTVGDWAEGFGQGVLQQAVWLRGQLEVMDQISASLDGLEPLTSGDDQSTLLSHLEFGELAKALMEQEIYPGAHPLKLVHKPYQSPAVKESGLFNYSLRAIYDLYCCLRDNTLQTLSEPSGALLRRFGLQLGISGRRSKAGKEQLMALSSLADQRMWDAQAKLVSLYLADQEYSEISGFDQLLSEQVVRELDHLRQPYQIRQKVADYLREKNPCEWTLLLPFVRHLRKESPKVIRATRSWDWSYLRRQDRPWEEVEDYWLMHLITHEFWWLGIIELYWTKSHGPTAFRLTPDGLGLLSGLEPESLRSLVMAPTGWTVLEPHQMTVGEVALLMQFVAEQPLTCQWSLYWDQSTLHSAVLRGIPLASFSELLQKYCLEIPKELLNLITELDRQTEHVAIYEGYLLTCQEPTLIDSLLAVKSLALCIAERLSPNAAVVYPAAVNRLLRGSERNGIGITDRTEGPQPAARGPQSSSDG